MAGGDAGTIKALNSEGKMYPKDWAWKGEHWRIARCVEAIHMWVVLTEVRYMRPESYQYLLSLPLALHLPNIHSIVVHAGLLPHDPLNSPSASSQPLITVANSNFSDPDSASLMEELSILLDIPQNTDPWTLLNMRSVHMSGKKKGKVTKSSRKGTAWSKVWNADMKQCSGAGAWSQATDDEVEVEEEDSEEEALEELEEWDYMGTGNHDEDDVKRGDDDGDQDGATVLMQPVGCVPVTVIYGHAGELLGSINERYLTVTAGRGLDIKPFSKGIDTGCVVSHSIL